MSAIAGIFQLNKDPIHIEHGLNVMGTLNRYPADDVQTWHNDSVFLGCHAQWVTPESIGEQLPYYDRPAKLAITADAIIDNREELFDRLQVDHAERKGMPDSRLILLAYQKWGEESPKYLIGDFAFMIWDEKKHQLFGARDFSGNRTLYYYRNQELFAFCTTIQPLRSLPFVQNQLNEQWLAEFLAIPGMVDAVDAGSTVYKDIELLPPSHTILVTNGRVVLSRYCTLSAGDPLRLKTNDEYEEAFREVFNQAVTARLRTHRNVGARLSGGLDSGSVVSFAANALHKENKCLHTFSYVPVKDFVDWTPKSRVADERPFIQSTVRYVGNIKDYYLDFEGKSPLSEVDELLEELEMPYKFFENSYWLKGIYEQAQQLGIGVLLNGARGNYSISWGSALDYYAILLKKLKWFHLYRELQLYSKNKGIKKGRILSIVGKKAFPLLERFHSSKEKYQFPMLINEELARKTNVFDKIKKYGFDDTGSSLTDIYESRKRQFEQLCYWNKNGTRITKLSLRYSVWDRDPTNDLRVIRFCLSVPEGQFVQDGLDRALIRRSTKNLLPDNVRLNQRTRGIQGADGIHRMNSSWNAFMEEVQQLCTDSAASEFLNVPVIKSAISKLREDYRPEDAFGAEFKVLMRSLIVYRFIKKYA